MKKNRKLVIIHGSEIKDSISIREKLNDKPINEISNKIRYIEKDPISNLLKRIFRKKDDRTW